VNDIRFLEESVAVSALPQAAQDFLRDHDFLDRQPGPEAAALLFEIEPRVFAPVVGAAVPNAKPPESRAPNSKRSTFPKLIDEQEGGRRFRMMGSTLFVTAPYPRRKGEPDTGERIVVLGWDRRPEEQEGLYHASSEGGVPGGMTYRGGAIEEFLDEFFVAVVYDGKVTRVVPGGFPTERCLVAAPGTLKLEDEFKYRDNPFRVVFEAVVECGNLVFVGYHDYPEGGWLSAMHWWDFIPATGMTAPLWNTRRGDYALGLQDAWVPIKGADSKATARVSGRLTAFSFEAVLQGKPWDQIPSVGDFVDTQAFKREDGTTTGVRAPFHPTAVEWAKRMADWRLWGRLDI
jgi:hypothetical protein